MRGSLAADAAPDHVERWHPQRLQMVDRLPLHPRARHGALEAKPVFPHLTPTDGTVYLDEIVFSATLKLQRPPGFDVAKLLPSQAINSSKAVSPGKCRASSSSSSIHIAPSCLRLDHLDQLIGDCPGFKQLN